MLFKKKEKPFTVKVNKKPAFKTSKLVETILHGNTGALSKIKKVERYVQAKLEGMTTKDAKSISGIVSGSNKQIVSSPVGQIVMENLLLEHYGNKKIIDKIQDLWEAKDTRVHKSGEMFYTPNWEAQKNALDRVLALRGFTAKDKGSDIVIPTQIVFNVQQLPPKIEVVDVKPG